MCETRNLRHRKLQNGQIQKYDRAVADFEILIVDMQAVVEEFIEKGLPEVLPIDTPLSVESLCKLQQLVIEAVDGVFNTSPKWTTRSLDESLRFFLNGELHELDFDVVNAEELTYSPKAEMEQYEEVTGPGGLDDNEMSGSSESAGDVDDMPDGDMLDGDDMDVDAE